MEKNLLSDRLAGTPRPHISLNKPAEKALEAVRRKINNKTYQFEACSCAICNQDDFLILSEGERYGLPIKKVICRFCGLIQTNPDMREQDYTDFYKNHYRTLYFGDLVGTPADLFDQQIWKGQVIREFIVKHSNLKPGSLVLEVGCGSGGILELFKREGFRVIGVDYGAVNLAYAAKRGIETYEGNLKSLNLQERPNLIIYSHVLEHIKDINSELQYVHNLLSDDGLLYIEVPGVLNLRWNTYQADLLKAFHIAHIYDFSLKTLCNETRKSGFKLIFGNEYIRSLHLKSERALNIENDFDAIHKYLKKTEKFHLVFGSLARARIKSSSALKIMNENIIKIFILLGIYSFVKSKYRNLKEKSY